MTTKHKIDQPLPGLKSTFAMKNTLEPVKKPLLVILGQTASGKSSTAIHTALALGTQIVMADSMAVYEGMDIGTAKPDSAELGLVPHYGINLTTPDQTFSTAQWLHAATKRIDKIHSAGHIPVLVCGTGLYLKALEEGLSELPTGDEKLRAELEQYAKQHGATALHEKLAEHDPEKAAQIHPNNIKRVVRALEICMKADTTPTKAAKQHSYVCPYQIIKFGLRREKTDLHQRINKRVDLMVQQGLVDEVSTLLENPGLALTARQAIGYKQMIEFLRGEITLGQVTEKIKLATRQYAKRQMTWFRKVKNVNWIDLAPDTKPEQTAKTICEKTLCWLDGKE